MSRVVQLSEASTIGLHSMIMIARAKGIIKINQITNHTGASSNHLAKVMQRLVKANLVRSTRGPNGGFMLRKKPEEITVLDIYEAIEGPIDVEGCPMVQPMCPFDKCLMGSIVKQTTEEIIAHFKSQTLKDFLIL
jgi:Rrf2 family protein